MRVSNPFVGFLCGAAIGVPVAYDIGANVPFGMILFGILGAFAGFAVDGVKNG